MYVIEDVKDDKYSMYLSCMIGIYIEIKNKRRTYFMKRKVLSAILCFSMAGMLFAGCGNNQAAPAATEPADDANTEAEEPAADAQAQAPTKSEDNEGMMVYLVSKGFQHQYWQAVWQGAQEKAEELGVEVQMQGPDTESDIAQQVQMLNTAIQLQPDAIGLAALDVSALNDGIAQAQSAGIPIIGFDSGVPEAPEGAVYANAATDNYAAGALAAEETYKLIKDTIGSAQGSARIGVMNQDATAESIINRGLGFIDKMAELVIADGKTVSIVGNEKYVNDSMVTDKGEGGDVILDVAVPSKVEAALSSTDAQTLLNKQDIICIYGSNQFSGEGLVNGDANIGKLGKDVVGIAFDSGTVIKDAVKSGKLAGAVTQSPLDIGRKTVELAVKAAKGESVADVDTGCQWFTAENMEDPSIAPNLYD